MALHFSVDPGYAVSSSSSDRPFLGPCLQAARLSFLGSRELLLSSRSLSLSLSHHRGRGGSNSSRPPLITAVVKRRKEYSLDSVIQRQKKLKLVSKIKEILLKQPGMVMSLKKLGSYRRQLKLTGKKRVIALLKKYPAVFEVFEEGVNTLYFRLTAEAEDLYIEEEKLREEMETVLVNKVRKLLMMSIDKTLQIKKIVHLKKDLGLPDDFRSNMAEKYPQYFKVIETEGGPALELASWDPALAISAWEKTMMQKAESGDPENETISGRPRKYHRIDLPKGYYLKRKDKEVLRRFQDIAYISPYAEFAHLDPSSREAEKHVCGVVHELLSLTLEKRTLIDHLTHFRNDFKFSQRLYSMLVRHPELFYVSLKGDRDSVFLREAYRGSELIEKDPLVLSKERLAQLVALGNPVNEDDDDDDDSDDGEDGKGDDGWSDDELASEFRQELEQRPRLVSPKRVAVHREVRRPPEIIEWERKLAERSRIPKEQW